jgi:hypothetical protein
MQVNCMTKTTERRSGRDYVSAEVRKLHHPKSEAPDREQDLSVCFVSSHLTPRCVQSEQLQPFF